MIAGPTEGSSMDLYLLQATSTGDTWAAVLAGADDGTDGADGSEPKQLVEEIGGRVCGEWLAVGTFDMVAIVELPEAMNAVALRVGAMASGKCARFELTPLISATDAARAVSTARDGLSMYLGS